MPQRLKGAIPLAPIPAGWQLAAAKLIRQVCYPPDGQPPRAHTIQRDLQWYRVKVARGESPERIAGAIRGAPLLSPKLKGQKWSPAKWFSKAGDWPNLFERCVHADGKSFNLSNGRSRRPQKLADILATLAAEGSASRTTFAGAADGSRSNHST